MQVGVALRVCRFFLPNRMFASRFFRTLWLCAVACWLGSVAEAQELREQPVPFSVWLDFEALSKPNPPKVSLPIWLESVQSEHPRAKQGEPAQTLLRLRLRRIGLLNREIQLRLFFDDQPGSAPSVTGWTETGASRFQSGPLGSGLGLPSSESLMIPVADMDYLEIAVPGDGRTLRGAFLSTIRTVQAKMSLDLGVAAPFAEPFGNPWPMPAPENDAYLFGRVKATIEAHALKLSYESPAEWAFELDRKPLIAVINFEVLNVDLANPPELHLNSRRLGAASPQLPDLADPGYRGDVRPREIDMRFQYTGWLRCQKVVPAAMLRQGVNELRMSVGRHTGAVAVRAVEIQLKHNSQNLDYTLTP